MISGVDVSNHQGPSIDWSAVARSGVAFAFVKASEGSSYTDPDHARNVTAARQAGLLVGSYHFARPSSGSAISQADRFRQIVGPLGPGRLPDVLDLEVDGGLSPAQLQAWGRDFLDHCHWATGRAPILYSDRAFLDENGLAGLVDDEHLWVADYGADPGRGQFWQHSRTVNVPGIEGSCDGNLFRGTRAQLDALAGITHPATTPSPSEEDTMKFVTADGRTVYLTNGARETVHVDDMHQLQDLEKAGIAKRPVTVIAAKTLQQLLARAR